MTPNSPSQEDNPDVDPLAHTDHRPWPLPPRRWVLRMHWYELLFAHWRIDPAVIRPLIPRALDIDTFDGAAWIAVVPFRMSGIRLRGLPPLPTTARFPEINTRTYVRHDGRPGVWFFSLDAASRVAVRVARWWYHLPYFAARMHVERHDRRIQYETQRRPGRALPATFAGEYEPRGEPQPPAAGTLEHFLTERYCMYSADGRGRLYRGDIQHLPWPLQPVEAEFRINRMLEGVGLQTPTDPPLLHYAERLETLAWSRVRVAD